MQQALLLVPFWMIIVKTQTFNQNNENDEGKLTYISHSPYYEPVHSLQFYEDE